MIIEEKRTEGIKMTGKILAGVSLSLALVTCVAMGVQGGDNDWENGCVQETCGTEGQKMTEQVRPLEIIVDEPDMEDIHEQNEDEPSADRYYGADGRLYGTDMNEYFIGDPFTAGGIICGTGAIVTAADRYLDDQGSSMRALDVTGSSPEELYERVSQGQPVVVWVTISMADRGSTQGWYTEDGGYVDWSTNDHGAVLIGYTETTVTIADPISGRIEYDREQFEKVFESRGNQCVVLE